MAIVERPAALDVITPSAAALSPLCLVSRRPFQNMWGRFVSTGARRVKTGQILGG